MIEAKSERIKLVGGSHAGEWVKVEIGVDEVQMPALTESLFYHSRPSPLVELCTERYRRVSPRTCVFAKIST